jgi:hypothetical protein
MEIEMATATHLQRTEGLKRQATLVAARIVSISSETPSVRRFLLRPLPGPLGTHSASTDQPPFDFRPGQWLDCFLPGVDVRLPLSLIMNYYLFLLFIIRRAGGGWVFDMLGQEAVREGGRDRTGREVLLASAGDVDAHPRPARYLVPHHRYTGALHCTHLQSPRDGTIPPSLSGDEIQIRVGGEFVMPDATAKHKKILFVAGTLPHSSALGRSLA